MTPKQGKCPKGLVLVTVSVLDFLIISRPTEKGGSQSVLSGHSAGDQTVTGKLFFPGGCPNESPNHRKLGGSEQQRLIFSQLGRLWQGDPEGEFIPCLLSSFWWFSTNLDIFWLLVASFQFLPLSPHGVFFCVSRLCDLSSFYKDTRSTLIQYNLVLANSICKGPVSKNGRLLSRLELLGDAVQPTSETE